MKYLKILVSLLVSAMLMSTFSALVFADSLGPTFSNHKPADGSVTPNPTPVISVTAQDLDYIDQNSRTMTIDGNPVSTKYYPANLYDSNGNYIGSDPRKGEISYYESTKPLSDGPHVIAVSIADIYGNRSFTTWTINIDAKPQFTSLSPAGNSYVMLNTPLISAKIVDNNLDPSTILFKVDGLQVQHSFDQVNGIVSYRPVSPLAEGSHSVSISVADTNGNSNSVNWSFKIDSVKPVFNSYNPANGAYLGNSFSNISVTAVDPALSSNIKKASLIFKLNGQKVPASIKYGGYWSEDYWVEDDPTTAIIEFDANNLLDKTNTVFVSIADMAGNTSTTEWSFTVNSPPLITQMTPQRNEKVTTLQPVISAKITDNDLLDPNRFELKVNGQGVNYSFDSVTGILSYTPALPLPEEDYVNVNLTVYDKAGNSSSTAWQFYAYTYTQEMPTPKDINKCSGCHNGFDADKPTAHPMNNCAGCHKTYVPTCYQCHWYKGPEFPYHTESNWWNNYGTPTFGDVMRNGYQVHHTNQILSCNLCHESTQYDDSVIPKHNDPFKLALQHKSSVTGCEKCHATTLTREHVMRQDDYGAALTCETCHLNPPADMADNVRKAIAEKNKNCDACHTNINSASGPHPAHQSDIDANCQTCHSNTLLTEPKFHANNGCGVCHSSVNSKVRSAIKNHNTNCAACHEKGHGMAITEAKPSDIPLYPGYIWTVPERGDIWALEPWFLQEFNSPSAKMLISNRLTNVSGTDVFNWYQAQMANNGWVKESGPNEGSSNFTLTYVKDTRKAVIIFYGGETHNPSSTFVGYRIEILYK